MEPDVHLVYSPSLEQRVIQLEERVRGFEDLLTKVGEGIEQAKKNPMIANMMKALGM